MSGYERQFWIANNSYTFDVPYDGKSIMHYGSKAGGKKVDPLCKKNCTQQTTIEPLVCNNNIFEIFLHEFQTLQTSIIHFF